MSEGSEELVALSPERRELFALLLEKEGAGCEEGLTSTTASRAGEVPISWAQERFWFLSQLEPGSPAYNVAKALDLRGPLDPRALERALSEIVRRHDVFRVSCALVDGRPRASLHAFEPLSLELEEVAGASDAEREAAAQRRIAEEARLPLALDRSPLLRARLLRLNPKHHVLLLSTHHFVLDGWSVSLLLRELLALYGAFATGAPSPLPELPMQYADHVRWQRDRLDAEALRPQLEFWKQALRGAPTGIDLPVRGLRPAVRTDRGGRHWFDVPAPLAEQVKAFSRREGVTVFTTLLAAFSVLLWRMSRQEDLVIGTAVSSRQRAAAESLIGPFGNNLALRLDLSGEPSFRQLLGRARQTVAAALAHQDLPFEKLVEELQPERSLSLNPLFQVVFALHEEPRFHEAERGELGVTLLKHVAETARLDLMLETTGWHGEQPLAYLEYSADLFDAEFIERMAQQWLVLLEGAIQQPDRALWELPLLAPGERERIASWSHTPAEYPRNAAIHELFEEQVERTPEATALVCGDERLSYRELDAWANRLARRLVGLGVGAEQVVGVAAERSLETVVGLLAVLKAGGAYLPLDPCGPRERLAFLVKDAGISLVVCGAGGDAWSELGVGLVRVGDARADEAGAVGERLVGRAGARNRAYVLYTSGTTGQPNGVEVEHRSVVRLVLGLDAVELGPSERLLQMAPLSFDASTFEIWGALLHGARCVVFEDPIPTPETLGAVLQHHRITTLWLTASLFNLMVDEAPERLAGVRQLLVGGESLSVPHVRRALELLPSTRILNGYGPTEATTFACCHPIPRSFDGSGSAEPSVPIGRPLANTEVRVLDPHLQPVPVGVPGELCIGGDALARGYLGRPEATAERFVPHPFRSDPGARLYRTGDLARYRPDGVLEFLGRLDDQVKIRGFRVEPAEIAAVLARHPSVEEAAVVAQAERAPAEPNAPAPTPPRRTLAAYVVAKRERGIQKRELRSHLEERLPEYMVPVRFVLVNELPRTRNGKLDRAALLAAASSEVAQDVAFVAPRDTLERQLCEIWQERLGLASVGIRDDFFELGGHSLLAIEILARVRSTLGVDLPVITLFERRSVETLAEAIRERRGPRVGACLVALQTEGGDPPLFCVPGGASDVMTLSDLARHLGRGQPFYGLNYPGVDGVTPPVDRIEAIAETFLEEVHGLQPEGPYLLSGSSGGGVVAYEMARQLRARGERVALLALLDTHAPGYPRVRRDLSLREHMERLAYAVLLPGGTNRLTRERIRDARRHQEFRKTSRRVAKSFRSRGLAVPHDNRYFEILEGIMRAYEHYECPPYDGKTTLFRTDVSELPSFYEPDPTLGWGGCAVGGLEIHDIPGPHSFHIREPYVQGLAVKLAAVIAAAGEAG